MVKILHFSDAHIDMVRQGRRDPQSGLPLRTLDFLHALDTIVDAAISQKVDIVIFAGDAYRDRNPAPTFQREWGNRIMRLSQAGIFTVMVVGNHDVSPAVGRAHAMQEYQTLHIPNTYVISKPCLLRPQDINGLPIQLIGLPWLSRSGMMAYFETQQTSLEEMNLEMEEMLSKLVRTWLAELDPTLPAILTSHVTVQGALYGNERSVMLGRDMVISPALFKDERLDYVALGHIHKFQDLNKGHHPPLVYSGSIERVDFGEINDTKGYIIAQVDRGSTTYHFHKLEGRKYISVEVEIEEQDDIIGQIKKKLPAMDVIENAIFRLVLSYPRKWEALIDERAIREYGENAFEFYLVRHPHVESRILLPDTISLGQLSALELLDLYWKSIHLEPDEMEYLSSLAAEIIHLADTGRSGEYLLTPLVKKEEEA
ncbi:MAG TPA: hypothetical protein DCK95_01365 [Anaerolineaceae bacterium]|uniref:Nuclease SbcCD subunit D n=1 Tax=Anaerolinea thermophila TaxID=167964 RepID=A0A101FYE2_9CHLR|nr:MAG: Nuclease SbcCD subunit D [Anaerolinea thermophila]HAF60957.1 hypothetical protein [Anaerolineaceae bacterium]